MGNVFSVIVFFLGVFLMPVAAWAQALHGITMEKSPLLFQLDLQALFIGSSLILLLMCFAWARALRSYSMAILTLYFAIKSLDILVLNGLSLLGIFTDNHQLLKTEGVLFAYLSNFILFGFTVNFFVLKKYQLSSHQLLFRLSFIMAAAVPLSYLLDHAGARLLAQVLTSIGLIVLLYIAKKIPQNRLSIIFLLTLVVQLSFNFIAYLFNYWLFSAEATNFLAMLAFWLMAVMVAYLMGRKYYYHLRDEKLSQQQVVASVKASDLAQQKLLALQEESQEQLESRVQERTLELNIALQELEAVNQELKEKNTLDELSGLFNRRYYDQKIMAEFRRSRRNLTPLSLVLIDIDRFKLVNDNYGHLIGDQCIIAVAKMIKSLLRRSTDVGCRYGGEEFCLILPETDDKGALALAQEICQSVREQQIFADELAIDLTVSCGVTTYQQEKNVTPEAIFASADRALYKAKQAGRDQVQVSLLSEI